MTTQENKPNDKVRASLESEAHSAIMLIVEMSNWFEYSRLCRDRQRQRAMFTDVYAFFVRIDFKLRQGRLDIHPWRVQY